MYKSLEFISIPYTDSDPKIIGQRVHITQYICAELSRQGRFVYSPIVHFFNIQNKFDMPGDWEYWKDLCKVAMVRCNMLTIIQLDGWKKSVGVQAEIEIGKDHAMPMQFLDPTEYIKKLKEMKLRYVYYIDGIPQFDIYK